jgi:para-nitrobenzyl esterase
MLSPVGMRVALPSLAGLSLLVCSALTACGGTRSAVSGGGDGGPPGDDLGAEAGPEASTHSGGDAASFADGPASGDAGCGTSVAPAPGLVVTDRGPVQGATSGGTWAYLGIPYAAPPTGPLRWAATQAHACWAQTLAASSFGAICLQVDSSDTTKVLGQEDCLTANVWAPSAATAASKLPVLVFIHGGGNVQGSSADTATTGEHVYDGAALAAKQNAVVVTFNYRLGALGFLAHAAFGAHPGNYGTLDQIFLLGWVQRSVAAFGGDPAHVLVFGQSAGAEDTCNLVASPLAKGLFAAALMESGGCTARPLATAESFAQTWAQNAGCQTATDPAACMRALDGKAVTLVMPEPASVSAGKQGDYEPDVDGVALTDTSDKVIAAGAHNHVPFVVGSNSDETSRELATAYPNGMTDAQYQAAVLGYAGGNQSLASQIVATYPSASFASPLAAYVQVTTDAKFTCGARYVSRSAAKGQTDVPVWRYFYVHHLDDGKAETKALGAWHGQEIVFVFRVLGVAGYVPSTGEQALSDAIDSAWAGMATNGAPDEGASVGWPKYDASTDPYVQLDDSITTGEGVRTTQCDFWDQVLGR